MPYVKTDKGRDQRRRATAKLKQKYKEIVNEFKDKPCTICDTKYPPIAMDLHHVDPSTKDQDVSKMLKSRGYKKIQQELNKCVVLCAICHRLLHAGLTELSSDLTT